MSTNLRPIGMGSLIPTGRDHSQDHTRPERSASDMAPRLDMHKVGKTTRGSFQTKVEFEKKTPAVKKPAPAPKRKSLFAEWRPFMASAW